MHKILRIAPNSFSRDLLCRIGEFTGVQPIPLFEYCLAVSYRFAHSERQYLSSLAIEIQKVIGEAQPWLIGPTLGVIPDGGHHCKLILQTLFDALALQGEHKVLKEYAAALPDYYPDSAWLVHPEIFSIYDFGIASITVPESIPNNLQKCVLSFSLRLGSSRMTHTFLQQKLPLH